MKTPTPGSTATTLLSYNKKTKVLTVTMGFHPPKNVGETLRYADVPESVYHEFEASTSKVAFFNSRVRNTYNLV